MDVQEEGVAAQWGGTDAAATVSLAAALPRTGSPNELTVRGLVQGQSQHSREVWSARSHLISAMTWNRMCHLEATAVADPTRVSWPEGPAGAVVAVVAVVAEVVAPVVAPVVRNRETETPPCSTSQSQTDWARSAASSIPALAKTPTLSRGFSSIRSATQMRAGTLISSTSADPSRKARRCLMTTSTCST